MRYGGIIIAGVLLTHRGYSMEDINEYEHILFWVSFLSFFWTSGILNQYLKSREEQIIATLQGLFGMSALFSILFMGLLYFIDRPSIAMSCFYLLIFQPIGYIIEYYLLRNKKHASLIGYGLFIFGTSIASILLGDSLPEIIEYMIAFQCFKWLIIAIILFKSEKLTSLFTIDWSAISELIKISAPLSISILISGSGEYIDGILVEKFASEKFSIYRYGARELPIIFVLANALSISAIPKISSHYKEGLAYLKKSGEFIMNISFPLSIVLMMSSKILFAFFFTEKFTESALIFNTYLLLLIPRTLFPQTILNSIGQTKTILKSSIYELIINILLSYLLMQIFGILGIAIGSVIAYSFDKAYLIWQLKNMNGTLFSQYTEVKKWLVMSMVIIAAYALSFYM